MKEIYALYNHCDNPTKLIGEYGHNFIDIDKKASEFAKANGSALIIKLEEKIASLTFELFKYSKETPYKPKVESFSVPKSLVKLIIYEYGDKI